jgi:hypothetical protein
MSPRLPVWVIQHAGGLLGHDRSSGEDQQSASGDVSENAFMTSSPRFQITCVVMFKSWADSKVMSQHKIGPKRADVTCHCATQSNA